MSAEEVVREFVSINPTTEEVLARYDAHPPARVDADLDRAVDAAREWAARSLAQRAALLRSVAAQLHADTEPLAWMAAREMGKPLPEARAEVVKCALACRYFAEQAQAFLAPVPAPSSASESYVAFRPLGVLLAVMPWNFPYWQVFRAAAPALMAGNAVYVKHAENVTGCALAIEEVFTDAGAPPGLVTAGLVPVPRIGDLIADRRIAAVTLTGSTGAGRSVAAAAGRALKKTVLELGGSDAFIVLADADLEAAATAGVASRFQNAGQSCIAAKRFIVEAPVAEEFSRIFTAKVAVLSTGDPTESWVRVGPLAREDLRAALHKQVEASVGAGARVLLGGQIPDRPGWFYPPTVLSDVTAGMPVLAEETFGPVAPIIVARDADHAVDLANDSDYGLGGNLWTADLERAKALAARIDSGAVFINGMTASDPRLPFGGVKDSGYGRELWEVGIREFVNIQTIWVGPSVG
jgi:succinate-semialdehyde dehydrogenase/glutarate-semialdehyde dehydrogenase